ncbi:MAG: hypothetical protein ACE5H2_01740, partial [Terriglobia bacterium]
VGLAMPNWSDLLWPNERDRALKQLPKERPVRWIVGANDSGNEDIAQTYGIDATSGELFAFSRDASTLPPVSSSPPALEDLRAAGFGTLEEVFGATSRHVVIDTEHLGKEEGRWKYELILASQHVTDGRREVFKYEVLGGHLARVQREMESIGPQTSLETASLDTPEWWWSATTAAVMALAVFLLAGFRMQLLIQWKPVLVVSLLYVSAEGWVALSPLWEEGSAVQNLLFVFMMTIATAFIWIGGIRTLLRRKFPTRLFALSAGVNWNRLRVSLGLGLLRGALAGFALLGLHNVLLELAMREQLCWLDPDVVGFPAQSWSPALYALARAFMWSVATTLIGVALPLCVLFRARGYTTVAILGVGLWNSLLLIGWHFWLHPWPATLLLYFVIGGILAAVFIKYDLLTVFVATFTLYLWVAGYPNLILFQKIGAVPLYVVFALWAAAIVLGFWAYWGSSIHQAYRRVAGVFE